MKGCNKCIIEKCLADTRTKALKIILKNYPYCSCGKLLDYSYEGGLECKKESVKINKLKLTDFKGYQKIKSGHKYKGNWKSLGIAKELMELFDISESEVKNARKKEANI